MGARPIAILDSLRFGEIKQKKQKYLLSGVVSGISNYGNCMGIPTVGGELKFDSEYTENRKNRMVIRPGKMVILCARNQ